MSKTCFIIRISIFLAFLPLKNNLAQRSLIDSLIHTLNLQKVDSNTVNTLQDICWEWENLENYDSLLYYSIQMLRTARAIPDLNGMALATYKMASSYWHLGQYSNAVLTCDSAAHFFKLTHNDRRVMHATYLNGMIRGDQGRYDLAVAKYYQAIDMALTQQDSIAAGAILNSVALVHNWMGNYEKSEKEFLNSIALLREDQATYRRAMSITNLSALYALTERYEEGLSRSQEALVLFSQLGSVSGVASSKGNIGSNLVKLGRAQEAIPYLQAHLEYEQGNDPKAHASALMLLAEAYQAQDNRSLAQKMYQQALSISKEIGSLDYQRQIHVALSNLAIEENDYAKAFTHLEQASILRDTLFSQETTNKVAELTEQYESEKREGEINLLKAENQLKDTALKKANLTTMALWVGLFLLLIIGILVWNGQAQRLRNEQLLAQKNEKIRTGAYQQKLTELELKAFRAQMNPHFIFNCMNSINRLILENENNEATLLLGKFSKLIRMILEYSEKKVIPLEVEIAILEAYLKIEKQRFKDKMDYSIIVDPKIDIEFLKLPSMILQPFVENAVWHGLASKKGKTGKISIDIRQQEDYLKCTITDNGIGRSQALILKNQNPDAHKSMAMKVTSARLQLLQQDTTTKSIHITDLKDEEGSAIGTQVEVSIPIQ